MKLAGLHPDLQGFFTAMLDSYDKSKIDLAGQDNALMRMRTLLEKLWGELADKARVKGGAKFIIGRAEFEKEPHRLIVADCLAEGPDVELLKLELDQLYDLHRKISPKAKNSLIDDRGLVEDSFTKLVLGIDAIFAYVS